MTHNLVNWFEIYVKDMSRARTFYEAVLQVDMVDLNNPAVKMWSFPSIQGAIGTSGALVEYAAMASGESSTIVYFYCKDCAEEAARVIPAGGQIEREKMSIGQYGFVVLARDTEGNRFGLHSPA